MQLDLKQIRNATIVKNITLQYYIQVATLCGKIAHIKIRLLSIMKSYYWKSYVAKS